MWRAVSRRGSVQLGAACLCIDVDKGQGHPEEHAGAALEEEEVPHAQAGLQGQRVDKDAQEPLGADAGHVDPQAVQVRRQPRELLVHQLLEHQLVHLRRGRGRVTGDVTGQGCSPWSLPVLECRHASHDLRGEQT